MVGRLRRSRANQLFSCFTAAGKVKGAGHKNKKPIFSEKEKHFLFCKHSLESELGRKLKGLEAEIWGENVLKINVIFLNDFISKRVDI